MTALKGWKGRFYEDLEVGNMYQHPLGRTLTITDNTWFTLLTQNTAPIRRYASAREKINDCHQHRYHPGTGFVRSKS